MIRETLCDLLTVEGHTVRVASGGAEALVLLSVECPEVILLDLMMPGLNGWDVLEQRQAEQVCLHAPAILMSASPRLATTAQQHGAAAFLSKPFDAEELLQLVERVCAQAGRSDTAQVDQAHYQAFIKLATVQDPRAMLLRVIGELEGCQG